MNADFQLSNNRAALVFGWSTDAWESPVILFRFMQSICIVSEPLGNCKWNMFMVNLKIAYMWAAFQYAKQRCVAWAHSSRVVTRGRFTHPSLFSPEFWWNINRPFPRVLSDECNSGDTRAATRMHSNNTAWTKLRLGLLTGANFVDLPSWALYDHNNTLIMVIDGSAM